MAEPNQIVKFGNGLVDTAKALNVDPKNFINLDTTNTAIRYKKMAPIVIASRLKTMLAECTNEDENKKLRGFIAELETAQQHGIDPLVIYSVSKYGEISPSLKSWWILFYQYFTYQLN